MSCAVIRTFLPDFRTLPSRMCATLSFAPITRRFVPSLELKREGAPDHAQLGKLRQQVEQLLRQSIREVFLVLARAHVRKRQHRDGLGRSLNACLRRRRS